MFQSVAHDVVLALLALLVKTADASFDGPPIKYNIYGGGLDPCQDSNIMITGATTKLFRLDTAVEEEDASFCEHDVHYRPDGTNVVAYTKLRKLKCTADMMEVAAYHCVDEACQNCSASLYMDAFATTRNIKAVLDDPFVCFAMLNATDNDVMASGDTSEFFTIEAFSAQRFLETENQKNAAAEYWNYFFGTSCGDEWLDEVTASSAPSTMVNHGSHILGSIVAAVAMVVAIVIVV